MRRAGIECEMISFEQATQIVFENDEYCKQADIVILQRNVFGPVMTKIAYLKAMDKVVAVDLDDAYHLISADTGLPSAEFWRHGIITQPDGKRGVVDPMPIFCLETSVKLSGAVISPSQVILDDWKRFGVKGYYIPNYLDLSLYPLNTPMPYKEPDAIYIGGGGSLGHIISWKGSGVREALAKLMTEDKRVHLMLFGDERVQTIFKDVRPSQVTPMGWVPYASYASKLQMLDLGVIPLSGEYDRRRSYIKPLEYSCLGLPWIATDMEPTQNDDLFGMRVENTAEAWYKALKVAVDNLDIVKEKARDKMQTIREKYSIDNNVPEILKTYERIIRESK
jgi:glycosyltransferase involved in cell wall biosynthesis